MQHRLSVRTALLLAVPPLLWAGNAVVGRALVGSVPPLTLNAMRWALAFLFLLPLGWRALSRPHEILARWKYLTVLGALGVGSYNALQYMAVQTSTPINVTLITASMPLWMLAVGFLFFKEPAHRRQLAGAGLSLAGVALVLSHGHPERLLALRLVPGDLLMLLAAALWAGYSWMLARPPASMQGEQRPQWNWAEFLLVQVVFGGAWAALAAGVEQVFLDPVPIVWSAGFIAGWFYVALAASIVAYWLWGVGVATVGPAIGAFFINLTPLFAALLSAALLAEPPRWYHAVAFALIAAGIVVTSRPARR
ncbi:DMT family transporter [Rhizobacter sp. LjRoot28]|jgi:drug/metabolite transporter (DMT)-like permease|uniref:DMT family transporter n=1 Tax=Rhizobacter sp. LjRoot28 TaxID=3342309 RepID=UPI003ECD0216